MYSVFGPIIEYGIFLKCVYNNVFLTFLCVSCFVFHCICSCRISIYILSNSLFLSQMTWNTLPVMHCYQSTMFPSLHGIFKQYDLCVPLGPLCCFSLFSFLPHQVMLYTSRCNRSLVYCMLCPLLLFDFCFVTVTSMKFIIIHLSTDDILYSGTFILTNVFLTM